MLVGVVGAFASPEAITAQAVSTTLLFASGRYLVLMAKLSNRGAMHCISPLQLESYSSLSPAYVWPLNAKDGIDMRL